MMVILIKRVVMECIILFNCILNILTLAESELADDEEDLPIAAGDSEDIEEAGGMPLSCSRKGKNIRDCGLAKLS